LENEKAKPIAEIREANQQAARQELNRHRGIKALREKTKGATPDEFEAIFEQMFEECVRLQCEVWGERRIHVIYNRALSKVADAASKAEQRQAERIATKLTGKSSITNIALALKCSPQNVTTRVRKMRDASPPMLEPKRHGERFFTHEETVKIIAEMLRPGNRRKTRGVAFKPKK
jgi:hypothetical protein